jgi:hypothetical protein
VKKQQAGKSLAGAVVICELWTLAVAFFVLMSPVYKWSIKQFFIPNPAYSHHYM